MKKMPYAIIFIIIVIVLVFAGCLGFSNSLGTTTTDEEASETYTEDSGSVIAPENTTAAEPQTDANGVTVEAQKPTSSQNDAPTSVLVTPTGVNTENTTSSQQTPAVSGTTDYDILGSGTFYLIGTTKDASGAVTPMEMAVTPNSIYMLTSMDMGSSTVSMGVLASNDKLYMIYPAEKCYMELSNTVQNTIGINADELFKSVDMSSLTARKLSEADSVQQETINGVNTTCYTFNSASGKACVYMSGSKMVEYDTYSTDGTLSSGITITSLSGTVPADKQSPSSDYTKNNLVTFMMKFKDLLG